MQASTLLSKMLDRRRKVWLILLLFTAICMSLTGADSPFLDIAHIDSAMFFRCGSALMSGLTPYVEFTDSKGLYLWVFYGLGYLISPTTYTGVWVLSIFVLSFALYWCYRSALLLLRQPWPAMTAAIAMGAAYFLCLNFVETRVETLCSLPMAYAMYLLVKDVLADGGGGSRLTGREAFRLGAAVAIVSLVKWNVAAQLGIFCLAIFAVELSDRESRKSLWQKTGWFCLGAVALWLPAVIYLLANGALAAFWQDYILEPAQLANLAGSLTEKINKATAILNHSRISKILFLLDIPASILLFRRQKGLRRWIMLISFILFFTFTMAYVVFDHYVQIMETWYLLVFILLLKPLKRLPTGWQCSMAVITACLIFAGARYHTRQLQENNYMVIDIEIIPEIVPEASKVMQADWKSTERPRILYYGTVGFDLGRALDPLPAGRYWFTQFYSGHKFIDRQRDYILHREPDYVFTMDIDNIDPAKWNFSQASALLKRAGYRLIYTTKAYESIYTFYLYRKAN